MLHKPHDKQPGLLFLYSYIILVPTFEARAHIYEPINHSWMPIYTQQLCA